MSAISENYNRGDILVSQQVKRKVIIPNKNGKYELTGKLPNNIRLKKILKLHGVQSSPSFLAKMKILSILARITKNQILNFSARGVRDTKS